MQNTGCLDKNVVKNHLFTLTCLPDAYFPHHLPNPPPEFRIFWTSDLATSKNPPGPQNWTCSWRTLTGGYRPVSYVRLNDYIPVIPTLFDITKPTITIKSTYFSSLSKINTLRYDQWLWGNRSFYIYNRVITDILLLKLPQSLNQSQVVML